MFFAVPQPLPLDTASSVFGARLEGWFSPLLGECKPCHVVGMAMGVGMEADFLSESMRETNVRKGFPVLESAEDGGCLIFLQKYSRIDPIICQQKM